MWTNALQYLATLEEQSNVFIQTHPSAILVAVTAFLSIACTLLSLYLLSGKDRFRQWWRGKTMERERKEKLNGELAEAVFAVIEEWIDTGRMPPQDGDRYYKRIGQALRLNDLLPRRVGDVLAEGMGNAPTFAVEQRIKSGVHDPVRLPDAQKPVKARVKGGSQLAHLLNGGDAKNPPM